jgi:membrane protein DedA with SNARE-associated domain/rhodanese-related sulfurtransferase
MSGVVDLLIQYGYLVIFGAVFAEQIGLPFPSEPFLLAAGALVGNGALRPGLLLLGAGLASLVGDTVWYWIGRSRGPRVLGWLCSLSLEPQSCVQRTEKMLGVYGARSLIFAKFVPGLSTVAPPLAGMVRMPFRQFMIFSALGALAWVGAYVAVGWIFSSQLAQVARFIEDLGTWTLVLVGAAVAAYVGWKYVSRRRFLRRIRIARISPQELKAMLDAGQDVMVVDVREARDFETEPAIIPGALHLTTAELERRHREIPRGRDIVLYCTCPTEASSSRVALLLKLRGIKRVRPLAGGYHAWRALGYPMQTLTPAMAGGSHA